LGDPFASNLEAFPWLNLQITKGLIELKERRKGGGCSRFGGSVEMVNDRGERRKGGVKGFLLLWPHGLTPGVTGQTGDGHRSDR
jgi:hypothetical protein